VVAKLSFEGYKTYIHFYSLTKTQQMKFSRLLILAAVILFSAAGCKNKAPKDLIVAKWKLTDLTSSGSEIPDSIKQRMVKTAVMEFKSDNTFLLTGMEATAQTGTYSLSDDGKFLTVTPTETNKAEVDTVKELTSNKLVLTDQMGNKLTSTH
jgi:hypothetical protein